MMHGDLNSVLLPYVMEFNLIANPVRFMEIAEFLGENSTGLTPTEVGKKGIEHIKQLSSDIGAPQRLSEMGFEEHMIKEISQIALQDACMITNPRDITAQDIETLLHKAL